MEKVETLLLMSGTESMATGKFFKDASPNPISATNIGKLIYRVKEDEMKINILALITFCVMLVTGCATAPMRTPNVKDLSLMLPEKVMIEGIKIEHGQSFLDCVPVVLEAVFKFYGKNINRKEINERILKGWGGTKTKDWKEYVKEQGFIVYSFRDKTQDKRGIKFLLAQNLPVLVVGKGFSGSGSGHIVILVGYDDGKRIFYVADPERRAIQEWGYLDFQKWHERGGGYEGYGYVIFPPSQTIERPPAHW